MNAPSDVLPALPTPWSEDRESQVRAHQQHRQHHL